MDDCELLKKYEPVLRFAKSERFFPMAVEPYLEKCTIDEIIQACQDVASRSEGSLQKDIEACQAFALERYSRDAFTSDMSSYLADAIR